jgi:hypothetical protein
MADNASLFQFWSIAREQDNKAADTAAEVNHADSVTDFSGGGCE